MMTRLLSLEKLPQFRELASKTWEQTDPELKINWT